VERVVRGDVRFGCAAGLDVRKAVRHGQCELLARDHKLRLRPAAHEAEDAVADFVASSVGSERFDDAAILEPWNILRTIRRCRVVAGSLKEIRAIEPGGANADENFVSGRRPFWPLDDGED